MGNNDRRQAPCRPRQRPGRKGERSAGRARFYRPEDLEMRCVASGHWIVEGYHVERRHTNGAHGWEVSHRFNGQPATFYGRRRSLTEACELVWALMCQSGTGDAVS
jgi:hypothetical protein